MKYNAALAMTAILLGSAVMPVQAQSIPGGPEDEALVSIGSGEAGSEGLVNLGLGDGGSGSGSLVDLNVGGSDPLVGAEVDLSAGDVLVANVEAGSQMRVGLSAAFQPRAANCVSRAERHC